MPSESLLRELSDPPRAAASLDVLIVADDPSITHPAETFLTAAGYTVASSQTAPDALVLVQARRPRAILLGPTLRGSSSLEFVRAHRRTLTPRAPLVVTSPRIDAATFAALTGAAAILPSPITATQLIALVRRLTGE